MQKNKTQSNFLIGLIWISLIVILFAILRPIITKLIFESEEGYFVSERYGLNVFINFIGDYSLWIILTTIIWGGISLRSLKNNGWYKSSTKSMFTMIAAFQVLLFINFIYTLSRYQTIDSPFTVLLNTLKSDSSFRSLAIVNFIIWTLKSLIIPIITVIFYFVANSKQIQTNDYALKYSWWAVVGVVIYFAVTSLLQLANNETTGIWFSPLSPFRNIRLEAGYAILSLFIVSVLAVAIPVSLNFLSNLALKNQKVEEEIYSEPTNTETQTRW